MQRIKEKESCHLRPDILEASERSRLRQSLGVIGEESPCDAGDPGSIPGSGGCPGGGNGNPLHYSCLENSTDGGAWRATVHGARRVGRNLATRQLQPEKMRVEQLSNHTRTTRENAV